MRCPRCTGTYVPEFAYNLEQTGEVGCTLLRCIQCGNRDCPLIQRNRARQADERRLIQEAEAVAADAPVLLAF